jgi:hypothetical protein
VAHQSKLAEGLEPFLRRESSNGTTVPKEKLTRCRNIKAGLKDGSDEVDVLLLVPLTVQQHASVVCRGAPLTNEVQA